jgi:hypothetical protein
VIKKSTIFWDITPCSLLLCLPPAFMLVSCMAYSSTLKIEVICSSETSVDFQRTTRRYIPEGSTLHYTFCSIYSMSHKWFLYFGFSNNILYALGFHKSGKFIDQLYNYQLFLRIFCTTCWLAVSKYQSILAVR